MRIATKLGLAEWLEKEAADSERFLRNAPYCSPQQRARFLANIYNNRVAAFAIRRLETEQEIEMLEWQAGGQANGDEPGPITILRPEPPPPQKKRSWLDNFRDPLGVYA